MVLQRFFYCKIVLWHAIGIVFVELQIHYHLNAPYSYLIKQTVKTAFSTLRAQPFLISLDTNRFAKNSRSTSS